MERSSELGEIIAGWFESVARGDATWGDRHISRRGDVRLVGTDPQELLQGADVARFLADEAQAMGGQVKISVGEPEAYTEGSVGWGLARPTITLPNGKSITPRWSAVFHREDGTWKLVQLHASVGITNEQLLGTDASG